MRKTVRVNLLAGLFLWALVAKAQAPEQQASRYDLLLKGGHVIDAKNSIDRIECSGSGSLLPPDQLLCSITHL